MAHSDRLVALTIQSHLNSIEILCTLQFITAIHEQTYKSMEWFDCLLLHYRPCYNALISYSTKHSSTIVTVS